MKALILLALLIVSTFAAHRPISNIQKNKIEALKKSGTWGGYMLELAEMHLMAQGPVDTLIKGIEEVIADLEFKHEYADNSFQRRTDEHNTEIRRLTDLINECKRQIADTKEVLANVLRPQKAQLEEAIADRERFIAETQKYMADETNLREVQHNEYLVRVDETNAALEALEEGLKLLDTLKEGGESSFVQVKKIQKAMDKIQQTLKKHKNVEKHFIQALVSLATSEFADSGAVQRVIDKLNEVKTNMTEAMLKDTETEEAAQQAFEADMKEKEQAIAEAQDQLANLNQQLDETEEKIAAAEQFIADREADQIKFQEEMDEENEAYEEATRQYEDLVAQLTKEEDACHLALEVIQNATFPDYLGARMEQDKVIDTAHGEGIATGAGTFDFQGDAPRME